MARRAVKAGIECMAATPHVNEHYGMSSGDLISAVDSANSRFEHAGLPLQVISGAEIAYQRLDGLGDETLQALSLNQAGWLLVESPSNLAAEPFVGAVAQLRHRGWQVLVAHPERCPGFQRRPELLDRLVLSGARLQITGPAVSGRFGSVVKRFAESLIERRIVHNAASDAHDAELRAPSIREHFVPLMRRRRGVESYVEWLTGPAASAVLAGEPLPPKAPTAALPGARRRRWLRS